ncbi:MAG: tetratricopeptide repeat protein [Proteobacteria bacterium]|nr:tetratricopeptide repeat protein [Pseudomonadota bacterium]
MASRNRTPFARRARTLAVAFTLAVGVGCVGVGCGGSIDARLAEIHVLQDAGEFSTSVDPLRSVLATDPDHAQANYLLGVALIQTRQPSLAIWPLRKAAQDEEYAVPAGLLLASTLNQMQGYEEAVKATDAVLRADPESIYALQVRANANIGMGASEAALLDAERVLELEPDSYQGFALKAMALTKLDRKEDAEQTILELNETARAMDEPGVSMQACVALAVFYRDNDHENSEPSITDCIERFPGEPFVLREAENYYDGVERSDEATALWRRAVEESPDNYGLRSMLAERLAKQNMPEEAEATLLEAAELFEEARAWDQLARFYLNHGDNEKALEATDKAIALVGTASTEDLRFRRADLLVSLERLEEAEQAAAELEEVVYRELVRARILMAQGDDRQALDLLESALTRWPNNAPARYLAGRAAGILGYRSRALAHYREATRAEDASTDAALEVARLQLENGAYIDAVSMANRHLNSRAVRGAEARIIAARASAALANYADARRFLLPLSKLPDQELNRVIELAAIARAAAGPEAAAEVVESSKLDIADPANQLALGSLVRDYVSLGRSDDAAARVASALAAHPEEASLHDIQGRLLLLSGSSEQARASFDAALAIEPEYGPALAGLASLAVDAGDLDGAAALLERASAADPTDAESAYQLAQIRLSQGNSERAEAALRELVKQSPGHAGASNDLAWILAEKGEDLDVALDLARRAARIDTRPAILDTLGWVQFKLGDAASALSTYTRALKEEPDSPSVRYRMGLALRALGRSDDALVEFREAVASESTFPESAAAEAEIAQLEASG